MKKYLVLILLSMAIVIFMPSKGVTMGDTPNYKAQIKEKYKNIDLSDGVSKEEAVIIAQNALIETGDRDCIISSAEVFGEDDPFWSKDSWHIAFKLTFKARWSSGFKWTIVNVDKKTGKVTPGGAGPS